MLRVEMLRVEMLRVEIVEGRQTHQMTKFQGSRSKKRTPKFENERIGQAREEPALFKSRFCSLGVGREHPCLSPDAGGASLGANPTERAAKSQDLNTVWRPEITLQVKK